MGRTPASTNDTSFRSLVRADTESIISLAHQPIGDAEGQRNRGQAQQLRCVHATQVEDDELSSNCQKSDEKHDLRLNDALFTLHDVLKGVIELQRNEECKNFCEHGLKNAMIERINHAKQEAGYDAIRQAEERDENYQCDDER